MKILTIPLLLCLCALLIISSGLANANDIEEREREIDNKQTIAIQLISALGAKDQEDVEYAYSGFMARFMAVRSAREELLNKHLVADSTTLDIYSKQLDRLIIDIENYPKRTRQ